MALRTLLEERRTALCIASLSDRILATHLGAGLSGPEPMLHPPALEATEASAATMNSSPAMPSLCLLSGRPSLSTPAVAIAGSCVQTASIRIKCPSHHLGKVTQHEKDRIRTPIEMWVFGEDPLEPRFCHLIGGELSHS